MPGSDQRSVEPVHVLDSRGTGQSVVVEKAVPEPRVGGKVTGGGRRALSPERNGVWTTCRTQPSGQGRRIRAYMWAFLCIRAEGVHVKRNWRRQRVVGGAPERVGELRGPAPRRTWWTGCLGDG